MNLWFRFWFLMLFKRPWRQPLPNPLAASVLTMRAWPTDLDINRHVTNGRYFSMADLGRLDFLLRSGAWRIVWQQRALPIVGDTWAKFRREIKPFERFEIHTRLLGWDEKWVFMEHRFMRHQRVVAVLVMRGLFRSSHGNVTPASILQTLNMPPQSPPLPQWLREWADSCEHLSAHIRQEEM